MHRVRFRLRTLLLVTAIAGGGLGWWFRPFVLEDRWPNGNLKSQLHVRRGLGGRLITNGQQRWWWSNGQLAREGASYGDVLARHSLSVAMPLEGARAFDRDGRPWDTSGVSGSLTLALLWLGFASENADDWDWRAIQASFPETLHVDPERQAGQ
jgi:hypothetical protein